MKLTGTDLIFPLFYMSESSGNLYLSRKLQNSFYLSFLRLKLQKSIQFKFRYAKSLYIPSNDPTRLDFNQFNLHPSILQILIGKLYLLIFVYIDQSRVTNEWVIVNIQVNIGYIDIQKSEKRPWTGDRVEKWAQKWAE